MVDKLANMLYTDDMTKIVIDQDKLELYLLRKGKRLYELDGVGKHTAYRLVKHGPRTFKALIELGDALGCDPLDLVRTVDTLSSPD